MTGCGHSSTPRPTPKPAQRDPEPYGHLSQAEYRSIVLEYTLLKPLRASGSAPDAQTRGRAACGKAASPNTRLMVLVRRDCLNALVFFSAISAVEASPATPGTYERLESVVRAVVSNALLINNELRRRGITGVCARSIGIPAPQVSAMNAAASAAAEAGAAARFGDPQALLLAQHRLTDALSRESSGQDPLVGIKRACKPSRSRKKKAKPARPKIPTPGEGIKA